MTNPAGSEQVEAFYRAAGFTVLDRGQPLPPFRGRGWVAPTAGEPVFWFWKRLA